jgi:hypothetical protein
MWLLPYLIELASGTLIHLPLRSTGGIALLRLLTQIDQFSIACSAIGLVSSGTPLLAVIVGNQQRTSSATICTARAPSAADVFVPFYTLVLPSGDTTANPRVPSLYIKDAGEVGLINL